jgi:diguanylate cyclase (GGDEF)-like protein/PAS domain S-box-containing protein
MGKAKHPQNGATETAYRAAPLPMFVYDRDTWAVVDVNPCAEKTYGYSCKEWMSMSILDIYAPEDNRAPREQLLDLDKNGLPALRWVRQVKKDGSFIWAKTLTEQIHFLDRRCSLLIVRDMQNNEVCSELELARSDLDTAQEISGLGSWVVTIGTREVRWSDQQFRNFGLQAGTFTPSIDLFLKCVHPEDRDSVGLAVESSLARGTPFEFDHRVVLPDGSVRVMHEKGHLKYDASGVLVQFVGTTLDVTERRRAETHLRQTKADLIRAQRIGRIGTWSLDLATRLYDTFSEEAISIFQFSAADEPVSIDRLALHIHPDDKEAVAQAESYCIAHPDERYDIEYRLVYPGDEIRYVHSMAEVFTDPEGRAVKMLGVVQDVTETKRAEQEITRLLYSDETTGLPNRGALRQRIEALIGYGGNLNGPISLVYIELAGFRDINLTLGHANGDCLLVEVRRRVAAILTPTEMLARTGNAQFAVLLSGTNAYEAAEKAKSIVKAFEVPFAVANVMYELSVHIGIALFPGHAPDAHTLLRKADVAVYQAQQSGQSFTIYQPALDPYKPERLALLGQFRTAIGAGQIELYCQPKVNMQTGAIVGAEALVRWQHPELGMILPDRFVPLIESTDLIHLLTRHMLQMAVQQCYLWEKEGVHLPLAVNLSARNLLERDLTSNLESLLLSWGGVPDWLGLEITESSIMADPATAVAELDRLSKMGFQLYLDDFGTGYSSLNYLTKLPIDVIKIDHGFTMNMLKDSGAAAIVKSTIELAHNLGMTVVAEGTASKEIWDVLVDLGCDEAQGHYLSPPLPAHDLMLWIQSTGRSAGLHVHNVMH